MLTESECDASSDASSDEFMMLSKNQRHRVLRSFEDDSPLESVHLENNNTTDNQSFEWSEPRGNQPDIKAFTSLYGADVNNIKVQSCVNIEDFYALLVTDEMLERISEQTNIYAMRMRSTNTSERLDQWVPTDKEEIKRFFGLIIWMGLVKLPNISLYWSKDPIYYQPFPHKIMSRNRFEILLRMLYFTDNESANTTNSLSKIQQIIDELNENFKMYYNPSELICINKSVISFHEQMICPRYMKQRRHKCGIKVFKLCCGFGYTYNIRVYNDKAFDEVDTTPTNVVMNLCKDIFHRGHTLCTNNWYTSLDLAKQLTQKKTHLIGTLRNNCKGNPKEVVSKKLKQGEFVAQESREGITILKWKEKRDVLLLSTKHSTEMKTVKTKTQFISKPKIVIDYNIGKKSSNLLDQMTAYNNPLRKSMKWYRKLCFELLLNTSVVNAFFIYQEVTGDKISITTYRKKLAEVLTKLKQGETVTNTRLKHKLETKDGSAHKMRRYCAECYNSNSKTFGAKTAKNVTKKVITFCNGCKEKPHLCLNCFNKLH